MIYIILLLCTAIAATKGEVENVYTFSPKDNFYLNHIDDYITLNKQQHMEVLSYFDTKLKHFSEHYLGRLAGINVQLDMVIAHIVQVEKRLSPMQVLSVFTKTCIRKYRSTMPTVSKTIAAITSCSSRSNDDLNILLLKPNSDKNALEAYYNYHHDNELEICQDQNQTVANQMSCILNVTSTTNDHTYNSQKAFDNNMETADCEAKAYLKKALDCSYSVLTNTISKIAKVNLLIDKCLAFEDDCQPCDKPTCLHKHDLDVDYKSKTIENPFYKDPYNSNCFVLNIVPQLQPKF